MDSSQFDRLVRSLRQPTSRRTTAALLGGALAGVLTPAAARRRHRHPHDRDRPQDQSGAAALADCCRRRFPPGAARGQCVAAGAHGDGPCAPLAESGGSVCPTCRYPTVGAAVADSNGPSAIRLAPGVYTEPITISRAVILIGSDAGAVILTQAGSSSVVTIKPGVGPVTLQGLRITGGRSDRGAGVWHQGTALTMTGCIVTDNHATGTIAFGGGVLTNGNATLTNCTISGNSATAAATPLDNAGGGGIANANGVLTLNTTRVTGNATNGSGGGIFNEDIVTLQNGSSVTGNTPNNCGGPNIVDGCSG